MRGKFTFYKVEIAKRQVEIVNSKVEIMYKEVEILFRMKEKNKPRMLKLGILGLFIKDNFVCVLIP